MNLLFAAIKLHDGTLPDCPPKSNKQTSAQHGLLAAGCAAFSGGGKKVLPDCEKAGRVYLKVYFLDFLIPFSYEEIDGEHFLIGGGYEKIGKIDEEI